jgi:ferritin-like metal-binding protein YciE
MSNRNETLQQYVSDMLAVEKHIHDAVKRQRDSEKASKFPEAHSIFSRIEAQLDEHIEHLEQHLEMLGGNGASPIKEAVSAVTGAVAGVYDQVRDEKVSKMLRDDYTALSLASISYTMLHTTGLGLTDHQTADIALRHLKHWTPIVVDISEAIPLVVAQELAEDIPGVSANVGREAVENTQEAWSREAVQ